MCFNHPVKTCIINLSCISPRLWLWTPVGRTHPHPWGCAQSLVHSESQWLCLMKEWMKKYWAEEYDMVSTSIVDPWLWSAVLWLLKKMFLVVPHTSWSEWHILQKLIAIRIIHVHSLNNVSACQALCHISKDLSSQRFRISLRIKWNRNTIFFPSRNSTETGKTLLYGSEEMILFQV